MTPKDCICGYSHDRALKRKVGSMKFNSTKVKQLDWQLENAFWEGKEVDRAPDEWGYQSVYCYCGHGWHSGKCDAYYPMSVNSVGYNRVKKCQCDQAKVGDYTRVLETT